MDRQKLLVIDDTPENLHLLYRTLKDDYEIFSATSGKEALKIAESLRPDLILLDVMMPEMNGFELCRALKGSDILKEIPVIFLTALTDEPNEMLGFEVGAADYIFKPFKTMIVKQRVANHLKLKHQHDLLVQKNRELEEALAKVTVLSGLLPICTMCKKIRDDSGYWNQLESYLSQHSEILFSHGLCQECAEKQLNDLNALLARNSRNVTGEN